MSPDEAVRGFLEALDVPAPRIPVGFEAQVGLYRSLLAGRQLLVVLDNARDVDQVRPLLPGSPGCRAVVTSRNRLSSLLAKEGARPLVLDVLSAADAHQLLAGRVGGDRVAAEPRAADGIVARCARLPLALVVVAARAASHPGFPLASLAAELRDAQGDLDVFDDGGADTSVRAVFLWSYQALGRETGRLFRLLGLHPGPEVAAPAAASLAGIPLRQAQKLLAELARAHMIVECAPGRFAFHDLLRSYAAELTVGEDTESERSAATRRMLDHYLHTARAAALLLNPQRSPIAVAPRHPDVIPVDLADHVHANAWFTAEQAVLLAAVRRAADTGFETHAWQLAWAVADFFDRRGLWRELAGAQQAALDAAGRSTDPAGQAHAHAGFARANSRLGRHEEAQLHLRLALDLYRKLGDRVAQAYTHRGLAACLEWQGHNADALGHDRRALGLYRAAGHLAGQASALNSIGWCHAQLGEYERALDTCRQALALHRKAGNRHGQASTLDSLGYVFHRIGDPARAANCYEEALDLFRDLGDRYYEADTLTHLGDAWRAAGDEDVALQNWRDALGILDELSHPDAAAVRARLQPSGADPMPTPLPRQRGHLTGLV
jgi:tetratricopeptide (TPR) repeat protein